MASAHINTWRHPRNVLRACSLSIYGNTSTSCSSPLECRILRRTTHDHIERKRLTCGPGHHRIRRYGKWRNSRPCANALDSQSVGTRLI
eukprot:7788063-Pyramimonas_sp.AAC.1